MKLPATLIHKSSLGRASFGLPALITATAVLLSGSCLEARDYAGYRGVGYHGYGYGVSCGYGYGATSVVDVTNSNPAPSLPPGTLTALPAGAAPVTVMGQTYYFANGNYYSPQSYGGSTVFVVANP